MNYGFLKILSINYTPTNHNMYKEDLELNNRQWFLCHETQSDQTKLNRVVIFL